MNLNLPVDITKVPPIFQTILNFFKITYNYLQQVIQLIGITNTFASVVIAITIIYYMLNGGLLKNWWKIALIIVLVFLFSKAV